MKHIQAVSHTRPAPAIGQIGLKALVATILALKEVQED